MADVGDGIRATATFKNLSGAAANPTAVVCKVKRPNGTVSTIATANPSTGVFTADVTLDAAGTWWIRFEGTGAVIAASEKSIIAQRSQFAA